MLSKKETRVMDILYQFCGDSGTFLCAPWDILRHFSPKEKLDEDRLDKILRALEADGYLSLIRSDRRGEPMYVVTLRADQRSYRREKQQVRRDVIFKATLAVGGAVASFLVGLLLRALFS